MDDWIKLRQELKKHHLAPLEEKLLPEVISKLRMEGGRLDAATVVAEVQAAAARHQAKNAEKKKQDYRQRGGAKKKLKKAE